MNAYKFKYAVLISLIFCVFFGIIARLFFLMVIQHEQYLERSEKQIQKLIKIDTSRGKIFDRNMHPLAMSRPVYSVYASPVRIQDKLAFSEYIAPILGMPARDIYQKINNQATFVWLLRKSETIDPDAISRIAPQKINVLQEEKRVYPNGMLLADVLGFVGTDKGLGGLEYTFNRFLTGEAGYYIIQGDPRGVRIISSNKTLKGKAKGFLYGKSGLEASSLRGGNLVTTIDYRLQFYVEQLLKQNIERVEAESGQVIVMDVKTGDILAMANFPYFDPNKYQRSPYKVLKNSCLVDVFEPGSTFKLFTYAAALEEKVVTPGTVIEIPETLVIARRRLKEAHGRDTEDPTHYPAKQIIVKSMNIGTTLLAQRMGKEAFYGYIQAFGFGQKSGIHLPGETRGLVRSVDSMAPIDTAVMSFGQGISVTALQMVAAVAAIGNDGVYRPPRIIKHQTDHHQLTISNIDAYRRRRVVSKQTARAVQDAMESVVVEGTGRYARVRGYRVGGKTGTAQKPLDNGLGYEEDAYIASFVGLLPIQQPRYAIIVVTNEPQTTIWGSTAAAPLFSKVANRIIDFYDVEPDLRGGSERE
jgi:cell division protein FtsI (penicillin-binding protein 3)